MIFLLATAILLRAMLVGGYDEEIIREKLKYSDMCNWIVNEKFLSAFSFHLSQDALARRQYRDPLINHVSQQEEDDARAGPKGRSKL